MARYVDNPNGSTDDIAGICNEGRNVVGLMPHPERAIDDLLGSSDGVVMMKSILAAAATRRSDRGAQRLMSACLRTGGDSHLTPRRVADSLAVAVALGGLDEVGFEARDVGLGFQRLQFRQEIEPLLDERQALDHVGGLQFVIDLREPVIDRIGCALPAPLRTVLLERFKIVLDGSTLDPSSGHGRLVLRGDFFGSTLWHVIYLNA